MILVVGTWTASSCTRGSIYVGRTASVELEQHNNLVVKNEEPDDKIL
jgi:hypothetical protein